MPFLDQAEQDDLQKHLSGMATDFTLGSTYLTLRTKTRRHTYALIEKIDVSLETCYYCNTEIPSGRAYDGYISLAKTQAAMKSTARDISPFATIAIARNEPLR